MIVCAAEQPKASPEWKFDVLHLKSGTTVRGLLVKETATEFVFQDVRRKLRYDLEYIGRQSLLEDLKIMARTIPVMAFRQGAW